MKILHLDIETAPNTVFSWGLFKQNIAINQIVESGYTLCWAAKWDGEDEHYFSSIHTDVREKMIYKIWTLLDEADAVVHYNGARFDIPTLNREFIMMGLTPPAPYHQIDLLRVVRSSFRFLSNKLDYVAQQLGVGGKVQHKGMAMWRECMEGDPVSWAKMEEYNVEDVFLLERLYPLLLPWIKNHPNHALYQDNTRPVCPNCGSEHVNKQGIETTKTLHYQRYKCMGCGTNVRGRTGLTDKVQKQFILTQSKL